MKRSRHGFTLVELIIVIAVIGVLAAILIPVFSNVINKANQKSALSDARNAVTQYITEAFDREGDFPQNIVVFVEKAGEFYAYGYNLAGDGSMQVSNGGASLGKFNDVGAFMDSEMAFNVTHPGETPQQGDDAEYSIDTDGAFWLVPYNAAHEQTTEPAIKGFHSTKEDAKEITYYESTKTSQYYKCLSTAMDSKMGDDVFIYHGILLGGTFELESVGGDHTTPVPTPTPKPKYTVSFAKGDIPIEVTLPAAIEVEEGDMITPLAYPAPTYSSDPDEDLVWYTFEGWSPEDTVVASENVTLTAKWTEHHAVFYTLRFDANGGTLKLAEGVTDGMQIREGKVVSNYILDSKAERSHYTFGGWDNGERVYQSGDTIYMNSDLSLTATWTEIKYHITIDPNNGDDTYDLKAAGYSNGETATLPAAPTKSGWQFDYWKCSNDEIHRGANATYDVPGKNVTFTAQYKKYYTVEFYSYDYDGVTGTPEVTKSNVVIGDTFSVPSTTTKQKPTETTDWGEITYQFTGWNETGGSNYAPGSSYTVSGDAKLIAEFLNVPKFRVSFSAGVLADNPNVTGMPTSFTATPTTVVIPTGCEIDGIWRGGSPSFTWPGTGSNYVFDGWLPASTVMAEESVTFVAQWTEIKTYTVKFEQGEGSSMSVPSFALATGYGTWNNGGIMPEGTNITSLLSSATATKANATFLGWEYNGTTYTGSTNVAVSANMTFTAKFNDIRYKVQYTDGTTTYTQGSDYVPNASITTLTATACGFTAPSGKVFDKWTSKSGIQYAAGAPYTVTADELFTATWKDDGRNVTVSFYDTWNEETVKTVTVNVSGDTISYSSVSSQAPEYWVQGSTTTVSITTSNTATFNGDRHNKNVSGDVGTDYQVLTTLAGLIRVSGVATSSQTSYPTEAEAQATMSRNYWMLNNIVFSGNKVWDPLGWTTGNDVSFSGKFDGNSKQIGGTVSGVTSGGLLQMDFETANCNHLGLFAQIDGANAKVSNLYVCFDVIVADSYIGGIAGELFEGTISNCAVWANKFEGSNEYSNTGIVGGIVGRNNNGTIEKCASVVMDVDAINWSGGIAGQNFGTIDQCYALGGCNGNYYTYINNGSLSTYYAGGIVGGNKGTVSNCFARPVYYVCAKSYIGGICGINYSGGTLTNCWNDNNSKCSGSSYANIFCGSNSGTTNNCYTVSTTTGTANGATRITAANLKKKTSITGWSASIWNYNTTSQYPTLKNITMGPDQLTNLSI